MPVPGSRGPEAPIVVIGAGIIGLCIAEQLSRRGMGVVIVDKSAIAAGASFGNAGLVSFGHPPLTRPGMFARLLSSMTSPRSPLHFPPTLKPSTWVWAIGFARACRDERFRIAMRSIVDLSRLSRDGFDRFATDLSLDFDYRRTGYMDVYRDESAFADAAGIAELTTAMGIRETPVSPDRALARQPILRPGIAGAILHEEAGSAHPAKLCDGLATRLQASGVDIRVGIGVRDIEVDGTRATGVILNDGSRIGASAVVLAAGPWSPPIAKKIGVRVPLQPAKGYHASIKPSPAETPITEAVNFPEDWVALTPIAGTVRAAGTLDFDGMNHTMRPERIDMLLDAVQANTTWARPTRLLGRWCGLRPCTHDGLPIIGWSARIERFFVATGHAMMGFWTAPATGAIAGAMLASEPPPIDPSRFRVDRF